MLGSLRVFNIDGLPVRNREANRVGFMMSHAQNDSAYYTSITAAIAQSGDESNSNVSVGATLNVHDFNTHL